MLQALTPSDEKQAAIKGSFAYMPTDLAAADERHIVVAGKSSTFPATRMKSDWRKQPKSRILISSRWFVQPSANCRNLGIASPMAEPCFQ
jgi:hypothetical protein